MVCIVSLQHYQYHVPYIVYLLRRVCCNTHSIVRYCALHEHASTMNIYQKRWFRVSAYRTMNTQYHHYCTDANVLARATVLIVHISICSNGAIMYRIRILLFIVPVHVLDGVMDFWVHLYYSQCTLTTVRSRTVCMVQLHTGTVVQ